MVNSILFLGEEPNRAKINAENPVWLDDYRKAMYWSYNSFHDKELKTFTLDLIKRHDLDDLPDYLFNVIGRHAWIKLGKGVLPEESEIWFQKKIKELDKIRFKQQETDELNDTITQEAREILEYQNIYTRIDFLIKKSKVTTQSIREILQKTEPKSITLKKVLEHYEELFEDSKKEKFSEYILPVTIIVNEIKTAIKNSKITNQAEKKKSGKAERLTKDTKVKQQDNTYNLVSMNPADIVRAKSVILFNTKTRHVGLIISNVDTGLTISGTTIRGFDEEKTISKILRNPTLDLEVLRNAESLKRAQLIINDRITGKIHTLSGRLNTDIVILKIFHS